MLLAVSLCIPTQTAYANPLEDAGNAIASFFGLNDAEAQAAYDENAAADGASYTQWENYLTDSNGQFSTQNIGRIWTDKTVSTEENITLTKTDGTTTDLTLERGSSDFLVMLSALSSTSNLTTTSDKPLDIVLVLDRSGSMADDLATYTYNEAYRLNTNGQTTYYAKVGDSYVEVKRVTTGWWPQRFDHWELNGQRVEPKTSANDATEGHIQFYTRSQQSSESKMDALKAAATSFIESTATRNEAIVDTSKQHRISIVSYSSSATINNALTAVSGEGTETLKNTVSGLRANGGTQADDGMRSAQTAMNDARPNAQKVILFFTDGEPGDYGFTDSVANDAIETAKVLKANKTLIYSVGVFGGADTTDTTENFNAYMHGVSSNYPDATTYTNLGERAENSNYYKAADSADDLKNIFSEIASEVSNLTTGEPTHVEGEDPANGGFLTFYDELGSYMKVDAFTKIVFNDRMFENPTVTESEDDSTVTYRFNDSTVSADDPSNVAHIDITVERSGDADSEAIKQGDKVTVKVPASLIPLRNFDVNTQNGTTTLKVEEQYPIRIAYGVSLKDGVENLIKNQDEVMQSYINENTDSGNVAFYSNAYSKGAADGLTTATFDPATSNSFYTFTTDTQLYTDAQCQNKATGTLDAKNNSYWYQRSYYVQGANNTAELKTEIIELKPDTPSVLTVGDYVVTSNDGTYIKAGSPRLQRVNVDTVGAKTDYATGTATNIINPVWSTGGTAGYTEIEVHLGNNGKITKELPGTLAVTKDVAVPTGFDESEHKDVEFDITVSLSNGGAALSGSYDAVVLDADNNEVAVDGIVEGKITLDAQGKFTLKLKDGQTLYIRGLSAGTKYSVDENLGTITYFDKSVASNDNDDFINAGATSAVTVTNTYNPGPVHYSETGGTITVEKLLTGRNWSTTSDSFEMRLVPEGNEPMPENVQTNPDGSRYASVTLTNADAAGSGSPDGKWKSYREAFGDITYTTPGTYMYEIYEVTPEQNLPGLSYSNALYSVTVTVTDEGDGLSISAVMNQHTDDFGNAPTGDTARNEALFTNSFSTDQVTANIVGWKHYTDNSEDYPLSEAGFKFTVDPQNDDAPVPTNVQPGASFEVGCSNIGSIDFPLAVFKSEHVGNTYSYKVSEVIPAEATAPDYTYNGMTYDPAVWTVTVEVSINANNEIVLDWSTESSANPGADTVRTVTFTNSYSTSSVIVGDDEAKIGGMKTLTGRNAYDTDTFGFSIAAANQATTDAMTNGAVKFISGDTGTSVSGAQGGVELKNTAFDFGNVEFTKPGTYVFNITEDRPAEANDATGYKHNGITYDTHTCQVTVTVTDENKDGTLAASVSYYGDQLFTNAYTASVDYGANAKLFVAKTLNGRDMAENEFQFTIKDSEGTVIDQTTNDASANGVQAGMEMLRNLKFDQSQVSSTPYTYVVDETEPRDDSAEKEGIQSKGVTYDQSQYKIEIVVGDNYDGTLNTTTTVTRVMDASGVTVKEVLGTYTTNQEIPDGLVAFTNEYEAKSISTVVPEAPMNKVLTGRNWLSTDQFLFDVSKVSYNGSAMQSALDQMPPIASPITVTQDNAAEFNLGSVEFTQAGTYVYQVVEQNAGTTVNGIAYSGNVVEITVVVKDNTETGKLEVESANITRGEQTFTNSFSSVFNFSDAVNFQLSKTLNGRDMEQGKFNFTVTADDEEDAEKIQLPAGTLSVNVPGAAGTDGTKVTMPNGGDIIFNHSVEKDADGNYVIVTDSEKTFKYTFNEVIPDDAVNPSVGNGETPYKDAGDAQNTAGWTKDGYKYDSSVYTLTITPVMHLETGKWEITTTLDKTLNGSTKTVASGVWNQNVDTNTRITAPADFVNSYAAAETTPFTPTIQKKVVGKDASADDFKFTMTAADDFTKDAIKNGAVKSDVLTGDTVSEEKSSPAIANGASGAISFSGITFTEATEGENYYTFNVTENGASDGAAVKGWTLDNHTYTIKVKVTDVNGQLVAEQVDKVENADLFTNTYGAVVTGGVSTEDMFTKTFTGRNWTENDNFKFNITSETEGAPMPVKDDLECTQVTVNGANDTNGSQKFGFGTITFTYDDIKDVAWGTDGTRSKTFVYKVSEVIPENVADRLAGVTYSTNVATLTIELTDDGKGNLTASELTTVARAENSTFVNSYNSNLDFDGLGGGFDIVKNLTGRLIETGQFTFKVTPDNEESAELLGVSMSGAEYANTVGGEKKVSVVGPTATRDLTQADANKTFKYTVAEVVPTEDAWGNYKYDTNVYTVTIAVTDDGKGNLKAITQVLDESGTSVSEQVLTSNDTTQPRPVATFNNTYTSEPVIIGERADVSINATKTFTNGVLDNGEFAFTIKDVKGNSVTTGTNDSQGHIAFNDIEYTLDKLTADVASGVATVDKATHFPDYVYSYSYTVSEDAVAADSGITVNAGSFNITVQVIDDADDSLSAEVIYPEGSGDNLSFVNTYGAGKSATLAFSGSKTLVPSDDLKDSDYNLPDITGDYTFTLSGETGAPMPGTTTANNDASGSVSFGDVTFDMSIFDGVDEESDGTRVKTFTYTVAEAGTIPGVDNDTAKTFTVTATDQGNGTMTVTSDPATGAKFAFTNVYSVDPVDSSVTANGGFKITKDYNGPDGDMALAGGEFKFVMIDADGKEAASGVNDSDGNVAMSAITFTKPGSYGYTLKEVASTNVDNGITYDVDTYKVTADVEDNSDGTLTVTWSILDGTEDVTTDTPIIFENTYEPAATSVTFGANKKLEGGTIEDGQFEFQVRNEVGDVVATAKNNASGTVIFPAVEFTKAGTYTYTITEVNDSQEGVTYDTTQYEATVTVTDDGQGHLSASVAYANDKDPVFVNTYTVPEEPAKPGDLEPPALPDTSDNLGPLVIGLGALAVIACAGLVIGAVKMRRKTGSHRAK